MKRFLPIFVLILGLFIVSCKKDNAKPDTQNLDKEILLRDSTYFYSILFSLWTDKLPQPAEKNGKLDLKAYTEDFDKAEDVLEALMAKTQYDRFSFIDREGTVSEEIGDGIHKETGAIPIFLSTDGTTATASLYVRFVQKNSPAEKAGLLRGMQILSINGNKNVGYLQDQANKFELYNKFFTGETLSIQVKHPETGATSTLSVTGNAYQLNPIQNTKVIDRDGKKIGYISYSSFVAVTKRDGTANDYYSEMVNTFAELQNQNIEELVIDLRYNGGGSTETAELMSNLLVPTAYAKAKMYDYKVNAYLTEWGWNDNNDPNAPFKSVNFDKKNTLNLKRVYFLVTQSSASASELVINVLKPYMDVQIISTNNLGSYGKPVGFFGYPVVDEYADLYITSFQMVNKDGFGDYFNGLSGTKKNSIDTFSKQLGDETEGMLADALYHIVNGTYRSAQGSASYRKSTSYRGVTLESIEHQPETPNVKGLYKFAPIRVN